MSIDYPTLAVHSPAQAATAHHVTGAALHPTFGPTQAPWIQPAIDAPLSVGPQTQAALEENGIAVERQGKPAEVGDTVRILGATEAATPLDTATAHAITTTAQRPSGKRTESPAATVAKPRPRRRGLEAELAEELEDKDRQFAQNPPVAEQSKRHHRSGAGARFSGDHPSVFYITSWGTVFTALVAIALSWNGLVGAAPWLLLAGPAALLLPLMIDVPIVVLTAGKFPRKARGETTWFLDAMIYTLATISAAVNFAHVLLETPTTEGAAVDHASLTPAALAEHLAALPVTAWIGAGLAAIAPALAMVTTEVLGTLVTRPTRHQRQPDALRAQAELARLARDLETAKKPQTARKTATQKKGAAK